MSWVPGRSAPEDRACLRGRRSVPTLQWSDKGEIILLASSLTFLNASIHCWHPDRTALIPNSEPSVGGDRLPLIFFRSLSAVSREFPAYLSSDLPLSVFSPLHLDQPILVTSKDLTPCRLCAHGYSVELYATVRVASKPLHFLLIDAV